MPIYEFACTRCRKIFNFLSRRVNPSHTPTCPTCGNKKLTKEVSRFAMLQGPLSPPLPAAIRDPTRPAVRPCLTSMIPAWNG